MSLENISEQEVIKPEQINPSIIPLNTIIAQKVVFDSKTNLLKQKVIQILFITLKYRNSYEYEWTIYKSIPSFKDFLSKLQYEMQSKKIPLPNQQCVDFLSTIQKCTYAQLKSKGNDIQLFLNFLTSYDKIKDNIVLKEFFEISGHSFLDCNQGNKPREGYIQKLSEFSVCQKTWIDLCKCFECCCHASWIKRWFLLKNDMICYLDSSTSEIGKDAFWFDYNSRIKKENSLLVLTSKNRKLTLKFESSFDRDVWFTLINNKIETFQKSLKPNIYQSFVNEKNDNKANWFIDGHNYFIKLKEKLLKAKETVFITDWWMSPEMFLIRPVNVTKYQNLKKGKPLEAPEIKKEEEFTRLCDILNYIAKKGVKIYILLYCEFPLALTLDSKHTKTFLTGLDPNIMVTRHPKKAFDLLWSHHEKLVIIDQKTAFVGGLDLCWGRYDINEHPISEPENAEGVYYFPGIDYSNARIIDFLGVSNYLKESVERIQPRMPWHDFHTMFQGPAVLDASRHFVERWNFAKNNENKEGLTEIKTNLFNKPENEVRSSMKALTLAKDKNLIKKTYTHQESAQRDNILLHSESLSHSNQKNIELETIKERDEEVKKEEENQEGDIKIDELNKEKDDTDDAKEQEEKNFHNVGLKRLQTQIEYKKTEPMKKEEGPFDKMKTFKKKIMNKLSGKTKVTIADYVNLKNYHLKFKQNEPRMTIQCLRSLSKWSGGLKTTENSILQGYYQLIDNAEHYIYIENQFFISKSFTEEEYKQKGKPVSNLIINEIALHLRNRIMKAYNNNEKFKVIIFLPLLPGFAGEIEDSSTLQVIIKFTYKTISRNKGLSLVEKLYDLMGDRYSNYISFYSLRQHGIINGIPTTELIYIHSKFMIVDDKYFIVGSANINDRSMTGDRDSEFAVIYKDQLKMPSIMDGKDYNCSIFAKTLRMKLWTEHLGITDKDEELINWLMDPLNDNFYETVKKRARKNTEVYRDIFNCYPDDTMKNFKEIPKKPKELPEEKKLELIEKYNKRKDEIIGHIVEFPLNFLQNQILERSFFSSEMLVPIKNFV